MHKDDKMELTLKQKIAPYEPQPGEQYMNDMQLKHFKRILEQWKGQLMLIVDQTISELQQTDVSADPNDRATQEEEFNVKLRTRDRERKLLKKIEETLNQIDEKEYGYCDTCGIDIGIRRLEARPTATLCIDCKSLAEIKEKRS
jgi:DnaK suppressor protein